MAQNRIYADDANFAIDIGDYVGVKLGNLLYSLPKHTQKIFKISNLNVDWYYRILSFKKHGKKVELFNLDSGSCLFVHIQTLKKCSFFIPCEKDFEVIKCLTMY